MFFQALLPETKSVVVPAKNLDDRTASVAENEDTAGEDVQLQVVGYYDGETIDRLTHVRRPKDNENKKETKMTGKKKSILASVAHTRKTPRLARVTLELTNHCNLNCTFCPRRHMERERGFMDKEFAKKIINQMNENSISTLVPFFRGESLLHPNWHEILRHASSKDNIDIQFTTNASLLNSSFTEKILELNLDFISFSLDTTNPQLYKQHRLGANYETTLNNVLHFIKRRDQLGAKTKIQVSAVDIACYSSGIEDFIHYWRPKVERVRIYAEHSADGKPGSIEEELPRFDKRLPCKKIYTDMVLLWNGDVAICNHDWTRRVSGDYIGNARKSSLLEIWNSEAYNQIRMAHEQNDFANQPLCANCDHWKMYYMKSGHLGKTYTRN